MNDIAKGEVCTGQDAHTVPFVFVHVCVVVWRDSPLPKYLNRYCTITTLGSQGVTRDGCEQYWNKFIGENFV